VPWTSVNLAASIPQQTRERAGRIQTHFSDFPTLLADRRAGFFRSTNPDTTMRHKIQSELDAFLSNTLLKLA